MVDKISFPKSAIFYFPKVNALKRYSTAQFDEKLWLRRSKENQGPIKSCLPVSKFSFGFIWYLVPFGLQNLSVCQCLVVGLFDEAVTYQ